MIEWHRIESIEVCPKTYSVTLRTKEGYPMAQSQYKSYQEAIENASKCLKIINKAKGAQ